MSALNFPNPRLPTREGVIALGGKLTPENLVLSYSQGIFPWPHEGYPLLWFCPDERGIIEFSEMCTPKSFEKWHRRNASQFLVTRNKDFSAVIKNCRQQIRAGQAGSWINNAMEKAYCQLHEMGKAHSVEIWHNEILVGGIYGVQSEKYFSCESMFYKVSNASKLALFELIQILKSQQQTWMDIQMVTDVSGSFGGKLITKADFLDRIGY